MAITIAVANQKGGTGKTTTAVNLAAGLALKGKKVLLVDVDPQGHASKHLKVNQPEVMVADVMDGRCDPLDATYATEIDGLYVLASTSSLSQYEARLATVPVGRETKLKRALEPLKSHVDFVIIDCPPALDLMTINSLSAADQVIVATQSEYFSMEGASQFFSLVKAIQEEINPHLHIGGILLTMHNTWTVLNREVESLFESEFPGLLFETKVRRNIRLAEAPAHGQPVQRYDRNCPGSRDYSALTEEVLQRCQSSVSASSKTAR